jgi:hypothetical protein
MLCSQTFFLLRCGLNRNSVKGGAGFAFFAEHWIYQNYFVLNFNYQCGVSEVMYFHLSKFFIKPLGAIAFLLRGILSDKP